MTMERQKFFDTIRHSQFNGHLNQSQVEGMEGILDAFVTHGDGRAKTLAYALATAYHEVGGRMVPVREGFAETDLGARRAVNALARRRGPRSAVAKYAKPTGPFGHVYYGRGHVQLTWLDNYKESSNDAGVDLVENPDAMLDPIISARVLIRGLMDGRWNGSKGVHRRKGVAFYLSDTKDDVKNARRTVNVLNKWSLIGGYYKAFLAAIEKAGGVPKAAEPKPQEPPARPPPPTIDGPGVPVKKDTKPKPPAVVIDDNWGQGEPIPAKPPPDKKPIEPRTEPAPRGGFSYGGAAFALLVFAGGGAFAAEKIFGFNIIEFVKGLF